MSQERGRDPIVSTGRGGAGNLVRESSVGPDSGISDERGREFSPRPVERAIHAGRGGAGNIRSPSRDPKRDAISEAQEDALQEKLIAERRGREMDKPFSSGRGGAGNISDSRSRSRSAVRGGAAGASDRGVRDESRSRSRMRDSLGPVHSGRGGYGNIVEEGHEENPSKRVQEALYEKAVKAKYDEEEGHHQ
ncbi:hypothetical protein VHUM_03968 [Vanrija humicola]|uniref:Uncharacterized protein n=1 Tax=Vanrija humicola TaxID=5417 RepID=A0A7D8Z5W7_VANHU|nr:hypothetical protein VHUM_03968 [Vanrija humicola]